MRWVTRLTAAAMILIVVAGVVLYIRSRIPTSQVAGTFRTHVKLRDGSRLAPGSPVVIAGVQVGVIEKLTVEGGLARIDLRLRDDLDLPADSFATRRADSLFGDSYIEIIPRTGDDGAGARRLESGQPIAHVVEGGSTDALLRGIAGALPRIDSALDRVHDTAIDGRAWVSGPVEDRLEAAELWLSEGHIERPLDSASRAAARLDELTARGAERIARAGPEVEQFFDRVDRAVASARGGMRDTKDGLGSALRRAREGLDELDPQIAQARDVMSAIDEGRGDDWRGSLGRLVRDPELGDTLDDVTASGRDAAGGLNRFRSWLGMRVEYDVFSRDVRVYATAEIRARNDKFYLVEFERGGLGDLPSDELSDVLGSDAYLRRQEIRDRYRFTAQFGKQLGMFAVRGGIKDSTFGVGADALLFGGRLKLSTDVFGAFQTTPRLKVAGALAVFRSLYVLAGVDDALNTPGYHPIVKGAPGAPTQFDQVRHGRDYFVGGTLHFNDEDIALLLRLYGAVVAGLLL